MKKILDLILKPINFFRGEAKDWRRTLRDIFYSFLVVMLINMFLFQNYLIPSGSMEPNLMIGDRLFANRFMYGVKIPFTDGISGLRFPKIKEPKRGDIVIFRAPPSSYVSCEGRDEEDLIYAPSPFIQALKGVVMILSLSPFSTDPRILLADKLGSKLTGGKQIAPMPSLFGFKTVDLDPRKDYVKRVIGEPGDTVQIRGKEVYINGDELDDEWAHFKRGKDVVVARQNEYGYPGDFYGPIYVPKVGDTIEFERIVGYVDVFNGETYSVKVNGEEASFDLKRWYWLNIYKDYADEAKTYTYEVEEPFYFVLGDNRDESCDSRFWGLVSYRYIKGQPSLTYLRSPANIVNR